VTVVATADHVLVTDEGNMHRIPEVAVLNPDHEEPRPWGSFSVVATDPAGAWKIKRLRINPQSAISLQTHSNRAETWLVLSGSARVTHDNRVLQLEENGTIHIPVGTRHRVENTTRKMLEILEIQTGTSFGEDDIRRFDDIYGRVL
jgi:mannose-6-phosphate isomerase-like protein (cupin superfamily)